MVPSCAGIVAAALIPQYQIACALRRVREGLGENVASDSWQLNSLETYRAVAASTVSSLDLAGVLVGVYLVALSVPLLWISERQHARIQSVSINGRSDARRVPDGCQYKEHRNHLVCAQGEVISCDVVKDSRFDVQLHGNCLKLRSVVEMYQVVQHETRTRTIMPSGHVEVNSAYSYTEEWCNVWNNSDCYADLDRRVNSKPVGLRLGSLESGPPKAELGKGYILSQHLISQCNSFQSAARRLGSHVVLRGTKMKFQRAEAEDFYYHSKGLGIAIASFAPEVGDLRVRFDYIPNGTYTVLALQVQGSEVDRDRFLPYRPIWHSPCGLTDEMKRTKLLLAGLKTPTDFRNESRCPRLLFLFPGMREFVSRYDLDSVVPELHHVFAGCKDLTECLNALLSTRKTYSRAQGITTWLMMFTGKYLIVRPFLSSSSLGAAIGCAFVTILVAGSIVFSIYLSYSPQLAYAYVAASAIVISVVSCAGALAIIL
eukprot:TRINITY_DN72659_c0_g1_i1.p1 TRINITY_DN72659_c0_g1~~TRINITY_DN72659_c0_g1_i1.p1  ORF type:complete len:486 (+),score=21.44 TRINITY_DN72659_c0_g1_i1:80-1537(+)